MQMKTAVVELMGNENGLDAYHLCRYIQMQRECQVNEE